MLKFLIAFKLAMLLMVYKYLPATLIQRDDRNQTRKGKHANASKVWRTSDEYNRVDIVNASEGIPLRTQNINEVTKVDVIKTIKNITARNLTVTGRSILLLTKNSSSVTANTTTTSKTLPLPTKTINEIITRNVSQGISIDSTLSPSKSIAGLRTGNPGYTKTKITLKTENPSPLPKVNHTTTKTILTTENISQLSKVNHTGVDKGVSLTRVDESGSLQRNHTNTSGIQTRQFQNNSELTNEMLNDGDKIDSVITNNGTDSMGGKNFHVNETSIKYKNKRLQNGNFTLEGKGKSETKVSSSKTSISTTITTDRMLIPQTDKIQPTRTSAQAINNVEKINFKNATSACDHACRFRKKLRELLKNRYSEPR